MDNPKILIITHF